MNLDRTSLIHTRKRFRFISAIDMSGKILLITVSVGLIFTLLSKIWRLPISAAIFNGFIFAISLFIPVIYNIFREVSLKKIALDCDRNLGLKERISSALEFEKVDQPFRENLIRDANHAAEQIVPHNVYPFQFPKRWKFLSILLILFISAQFLPTFNFGSFKTDEKTIAVINEQGEILKKVSEELEDTPEEESESLAEVAQDIKKLSKTLSKKDVQKKEALETLSRTGEKIRKQKENLDQTKKYLKDLTEELGKTTSEAQKSPQDDDMNKVKNQLKALADQLNNENLTEAEQEEIADALGNAAETLEKLGMKESAEHLKTAKERLENDDQTASAENVEKALEEFENSSEKLENQLATSEKLEDALEQVEQSKNEISQSNLPQMADNNSGNPGGNPPGGNQQQNSGNGSQGSPQSGGTPSTGGQQQAQGNMSQSGADYGDGTTNLEQSSSTEADGNQQHMDRFSDAESDEIAEYIKLYDPQTIDAETQLQNVDGEMGDGEMDGYSETDVAPTAETAYTNFEDIYFQNRKNAEDALKKQNIPGSYKKFVKDYFKSIEPSPNQSP